MNEYKVPGTAPAPPDADGSGFMRALRRDANYVGFIMLVTAVMYLGFFTLVLFVLGALGVADLRGEPLAKPFYGMGYWPYMALYAMVYVANISVAAPLVTRIAGRRVRPFSRLDAPPDSPADKPRRASPRRSAALAVGAGMAVIIVAQFGAAFVHSVLAEDYGYKMPPDSDLMTTSVLSLLANIGVTAVLPALLEERLFRGYLLRALLPHGRGLAGVVSSLLFSLVHVEPVQMLFAFVVGLACGYLFMATRSIWPAVALHFINNLMSVALAYISLSVSEKAGNIAGWGIFLCIFLCGAFCLIVLIGRRDPLLRYLPGEPAPREPEPAPPPMKWKMKGLLTATALMLGLTALVAMSVYYVIGWQVGS